MPLSQKILVLWFILLFWAGNVLAQQPAPLINWHADSLLTWSDFKGGVQSDSPFSAYTYYGITYRYTCHERLGKYTVTFTTKSHADPNQCWSKVDKQTPALLSHEQMHFNIAEFFARQLLVAFNNYSYTVNYKDEIKQVYENMAIRHRNMQELYDQQTKHSIHKIMQARWELYIDNILRQPCNLEDALALAPVAGR